MGKKSKPAGKATKPAVEKPEAVSAAETEADESAAETAETDLQQQLETAQAALAEQQENYLRAAAELENLRRRSEKKLAEVQQFMLASFALDVGEVRDCLEAALETAQPEKMEQAEKMHEGVTLTLRKLVSAMDKRHILPIKPDLGASFDPTVHMAIGQLPASADTPADSIAAVVQNGYMLNGRVIRAASVMVAAVAPEQNGEQDTVAGGQSDAADDTSAPKH